MRHARGAAPATRATLGKCRLLRCVRRAAGRAGNAVSRSNSRPWDDGKSSSVTRFLALGRVLSCTVTSRRPGTSMLSKGRGRLMNWNHWRFDSAGLGTLRVAGPPALTSTARTAFIESRSKRESCHSPIAIPRISCFRLGPRVSSLRIQAHTAERRVCEYCLNSMANQCARA